MNDTSSVSTLNPFSSKPKEAPTSGKKMGFFELDTFENVAETSLDVGGRVVEASQEVFRDSMELVIEIFRGERSDFQSPRLRRDADPEESQRVNRQFIEQSSANLDARVAQVKEQIDTQQIAQEVGTLDEEQLAKEGGYQEGYRGESLKSLYNRASIFLKRMWGAIKQAQANTPPVQIWGRRNGGPATTMNLNDQENANQVAKLQG